MKAVTVVLQTVQPVLLTSLQGDPNSSVSYAYIPGSVLRGALIARYLQRRRGGSAPPNDADGITLPEDADGFDLLSDHRARRLFFDGTTRYLNAYPYVRQQHRGARRRFLPAPRSWFLEKGVELDVQKPVELYDRTCDDMRLHADGGNRFIITKGLSADTFVTGSGQALLATTRRRVNVHNARERALGHATSEEGALFRYDAVDAGQSFQAVVLCEADDDAERICALLSEGDLWIGGSRSAGYGHVSPRETVVRSVADGTQEDAPADAWVESAPVIAAPDEDEDPVYGCTPDTMVVTLLSDLIARDDAGQHQADLPLRELASVLALQEDALRVRRRFAGSTLVGGFNRAWGLPLPQVIALAAGSVFVLEIAGDERPTHGRIRAVMARGLGERRVEGFGRIAIGWPLGRTTWAQRVREDEPDDADDGTLDELSARIAGGMAERLLRQRLDLLLLDRVGRTRFEPLRLSNSQLSRLAIVARRALTHDGGKPSRQPIDQLLRDLPADARRQYGATRVATGIEQGMRFDQQITAWLDDAERVNRDGTPTWLDDDLVKDVVVAGQHHALSPELGLEYVLRLIMALVKRASKEQDE